MKLDAARRHALSLPQTTEEPHFRFTSFRVAGKIFATAPPGDALLHVFVDEAAREAMLALHGACVDKLTWGAKVVGLRVHLDGADAALVRRLLDDAWRHKAPKALAAKVAP